MPPVPVGVLLVSLLFTASASGEHKFIPPFYRQQQVQVQSTSYSDTTSTMFDTLRSWWIPTDEKLLASAEAKMLDPEYAGVDFEHSFVSVNNKRIHTVKVVAQDANRDTSDKPPLLLVHGFGGGLGLWTKNYAQLSRDFTVYAIDVPGFGRSSKHDFGWRTLTHEKATDFFVESVHDWVQEMKLGRLSVLGHSMGGFIAANYAVRYPEQLDHLFLVCPFGVQKPESPGDDPNSLPKRLKRASWKFQMLIHTARMVGGPLGLVRWAGPWGPGLVKRRARYDNSRYDFDDNRVSEYVYHLAAGTRGGDRAFHALHDKHGYAHAPLYDVCRELKVPATLIFGERDFFPPSSGAALQQVLPHDNHRLIVIKGAHHHPYATHADLFHTAVRKGWLDAIVHRQ